MSTETRYIDHSRLVTQLGLQPGEDYGAAEECHSHVTQHEHLGTAFEVYFDEMAGALTQWKAFAMGIGTRSNLERDEVIRLMKVAIAEHNARQ